MLNHEREINKPIDESRSSLSGGGKARCEVRGSKRKKDVGVTAQRHQWQVLNATLCREWQEKRRKIQVNVSSPSPSGSWSTFV